MDQFEPYFADDTQGVHFGVSVDGQLVLAHIGRRILSGRFNAAADGHGWVAVYVAHRAEIDRVVTAIARANGPETVILRLQDLT
jgi:hypothetical protein